MDRIVVRNLQVRNITGVDNWERIKRQPILLTVTVFMDVREAGEKDALHCSVNYGSLSKHVIAFSESSHYRTVEALALGTIEAIFQQFPVDQVTIRVEKPKALLQAKSAGVELTRKRADFEGQTPTTPTSLYPTAPRVPVAKVEGFDDVIFVNQLEAFVIVGVNPWEREEKQKVNVFLTIYPSEDFELLGDHIRKQHNYRTITRMVLDVVESSRFKTVEALNTAIANVCLNKCHVKKVKVRVDKPSALLFAEAASVEIIREQGDLKAKQTTQTSSEWHVCYVALGSNLGNRAATISKALKHINSQAGCRLVDTSFLYETSPMYETDQPAFLNGACKILTKLEPHAFLKLLKDTEKLFGRQERYKNGPRELDLDILLYDQLELDTEDLKIPHPLMKERLFALMPLCDIAPDVEHPAVHRPVSQLLKMKTESLKDKKTDGDIYRVVPLKDGSVLKWHKSTLVMGILNATPDSFSDGGDFYLAPEQMPIVPSYDSSKPPSQENMPPLPEEFKQRIIMHVRQLKTDGCNIIDIGGHSTRPNAPDVSLDEELRRVLPVIHCIVSAGIDIPISIDTFRSEVAKEAVKCGASIVNDVSGGNLDDKMVATVAELDVPVCWMHMRGTPKTMTILTDYSGSRIRSDALDDELALEDGVPAVALEVIRGVREELSNVVYKSLKAGVKRWSVIIDPGIGFSKNAEQNIALIKNLPVLVNGKTIISRQLPTYEDVYWLTLAGFPVLMGTSRKSFIGKILQKDNPKDRLFGTAATCSASVAAGAAIIRVHDVKEMAEVIKVADAFK